MNKNLLIYSGRNILGAGIYIFLVSQVLRAAEQLLGGKDDTFLAPFAFLLLFVLSATVVGSLIFGQTIYYFFNNKKKESIKMLFYSIGWLFLLTTIVLGVLAFY